MNALKCKSLACSAFLKQRSRNSEHAQISSYMYMLAHVFFSSYNVLAWLFTYLLVVFCSCCRSRLQNMTFVYFKPHPAELIN